MLAALDGLGKIFDSIRANVYKEAMTAPTITVFVCLGSNTPDAAHMLSLAVERLRALPRARVDALSSIYLTEPQDYADQPWFHNQVVRMELEADWTPQSFVRALLAEEKQLGRQRSSDPALRFGPRCIDMDLLLFGDSQCDAPESIVPHPRMCQRAFVLIPLCDVGAACRIHGRTPAQWLAGLEYRQEGQRIFQ